MGWKVVVMVYLLYNLSTSCCIPILQKKFYKTEFKSYRPNKSNFLLKKNRVRSELDSVISQNVMYTRIKSIPIEEAEEKKPNFLKVNSFIRFFENGQFLRSSTDNYHTGIQDYNNLKKGTAGYYQIKNDSISLEHFSVGAHDCGKYVSYNLKIIGDSIAGYKKIKVDGLMGTPDW